MIVTENPCWVCYEHSRNGYADFHIKTIAPKMLYPLCTARATEALVPVLFMRALKVTHFRQLDDPLTVFGLEGTIFGSVFTLSA